MKDVHVGMALQELAGEIPGSLPPAQSRLTTMLVDDRSMHRPRAEFRDSDDAFARWLQAVSDEMGRRNPPFVAEPFELGEVSFHLG